VIGLVLRETDNIKGMITLSGYFYTKKYVVLKELNIAKKYFFLLCHIKQIYLANSHELIFKSTAVKFFVMFLHNFFRLHPSSKVAGEGFEKLLIIKH
jgi:hypothetical protein